MPCWFCPKSSSNERPHLTPEGQNPHNNNASGGSEGFAYFDDEFEEKHPSVPDKMSLTRI